MANNNTEGKTDTTQDKINDPDTSMKSPKSKRLREEDELEEDKMITFLKGEEHLGIEMETKALSKMVSETKDYGIIKLIECYNHTPDGDVEEMKAAMIGLSGIGDDYATVFKRAIQFVTNDEKEIEETELGVLADILIASIRNRMAKYCNDCKYWYIVGRDKRPRKFCNLCNVGMHDCMKESKLEQRKGDMWFCSDCLEQFTKQIKPQMMKKYRNVIFDGFKQNDVNKKTSTIINKKIEEIRKEVEEDGTEDIIMIGEDEHPKTNIENKAKNQEVINENQIVKKDNNITNRENNNNCHFWMTKKCKFGNQCNYEHPTRCKELMENGKCHDKNCKQVHPKICRNMLNDSYCSRKNCWFNHPTKIKNKYVFRKDNSRGHNFEQNQGERIGRHNNQGNPNKGYPKTWQNNNMDRHQYSNSVPSFLAGPTPSEAYMNPNRNMNMFKMMGDMFLEMSKIMNMNY